MKRILIATVLASALIAGAPSLAFAQATAAPGQAAPAAGSPSAMVLANSTRILSTLESRRAEFSKNRAALSQFITTEFNTVFDRDYAARLVLGTHGRGASDAEVNQFADALTGSLMQRYGSALLDFNTRLQVRIKSETPLRGGAIVKVSSEFLRQGGEPIPVDYLLRKNGAQWKVFDVMVEGVSFVQTFRNQFDTPLSQKSISQVAADIKAGKLQAQASSN
ncbi:MULTISPECIES: MlaC/ttg2D family ABC transporter substrate-binding protein [Lysobacter]|jgi:phospholipid transport system substrate-binding protein|uniref:ABC transporter substrate-binding protein n=1 Tax=Lysobacter gummosus TaxID=262324 RepID=A0ABY3XCI3_9GAMM|nr:MULTISPECIES: ABC transporter substrate-binding protein [Lysobacter]ALN89076.1 toluene tolerance, Ttg2 family protein [Lysobacter gummosus]UJB18968.1 ABC transporter substrate-binding protein [Lysobacter capsici]UJQ27307.1 ABC transporter substrate-binding protein [Lysobacter gummosus]UNP29785.1 ABC transporter substrate-binding protein [Lysobacter gummosus]